MPKKTKREKIIVRKMDTRYVLEDSEGRKISVIVYSNGRMSIYRQNYFNRALEFEYSEREVIEAIARLMLEAVKLK